MRKSGAKTLLMGGQACVFYGAAEFSRDLDLLIPADPVNLGLVASALDDLAALPIAVPPLQAAHLLRGHAVHFRCRREDVAGLRIDLMSSPRGVDDFGRLWARRTTIEVDGETLDLLSLEDLEIAKKTQRSIDWPMLERLLQQSFFGADAAGKDSAMESPLVDFWLRELRTPELLMRVAAGFPFRAAAIAPSRKVVALAVTGHVSDVAAALIQEEQEERERDRQYWEPLRRELEQFRRDRRITGKSEPCTS